MSYNLVARLKLQDDFSNKLRKVTKRMGDADRQTRSLTSSMGGFSKQVATIGTAIGLTAAVSKGFSMIRNSMDTAFKRIDTMEQFERVMNVMIGDTDKVAEALERTREAVTGTAYTLNGAASSVQNFVTRGIEVDKATRYIEAWGDAVAFYGDGSQDQFDNVNDALGKMLGKGKVTMDQLDRVMHAGIPVIDLYADKMGMATAQVQDALSKGKINAQDFVDTVSDAMMEGGNKFSSIAGAAKEAGATWQSVFGNMRTHIATGVESIINAIDAALSESGMPEMRDMVKKFGETFREVLKNIAKRVPALIKGFSNILKTIEPWKPIIKAVIEGLLITAAIFATFALVVGIIAGVGAAIAFLVSPIGIVAMTIAALMILFRLFKDKILDGVNNIRAVFNSFKDGIKNIFENISETFTNIKDNISAAIMGAKDNFVEGLKGMKAGAVSIINGIINAFNRMINGLNSMKINVPDWLPKPLGGKSFSLNVPTIPKIDGSHYHGIDRIPYDGYVAKLHKDERVQSASEAKQSRQGGAVTVQFGDIVLNGVDGDIEGAADKFLGIVVQEIYKAMEAGA